MKVTNFYANAIITLHKQMKTRRTKQCISEFFMRELLNGFEYLIIFRKSSIKIQKILHHLPRESYKQIISLIKELVLATNMEKHPKITEEWREISKEFSFESQKCRVAFMKCVLKFSDISNPARPKVRKFAKITNNRKYNSGAL